MSDELEDGNESFNNITITQNDVNEFLNQAKVEITDEDRETYGKKKRVRKKDIPTPSELEQMGDDEVEELGKEEDELSYLYDKFDHLLANKGFDDAKLDTGVKITTSTSLDVLDAIMGGGFALGTLGVIAGSPGSGKTMLAIQTMAAAQAKFKGKAHVEFLDSEEATTVARMANLGVRYPRREPRTGITLEGVFKLVEGMCQFRELEGNIDNPAIIVWDSVANTLSQKEIEATDVNSVIGFKARLLSIIVPKYVARIARANVSLIAVNQLRDIIQIGPHQQPKDLNFMRQGKNTPGGNALKYNAFHMLDMRVKGAIDNEKYGFDGITVEVKCVKNKLFSPNIKVEILGNFVTGFSNFWTNYAFLVNSKRMITGSWNYLDTLPGFKFRTKEAENNYNSDTKFKEAFDEAVKETIYTELIEKNSIIE